MPATDRNPQITLSRVPDDYWLGRRLPPHEPARRQPPKALSWLLDALVIVFCLAMVVPLAVILAAL